MEYAVIGDIDELDVGLLFRAKRKNTVFATQVRRIGNTWANNLNRLSLMRLTRAVASGANSSIELARCLGISAGTFNDMSKNNPRIKAAIAMGEEIAIKSIEKAVMSSSMGFKETVRTPMKVNVPFYDEDGQFIGMKNEIQYVDKEIYIPPNPISQKLYLTNKAPEQWSDKRRVDVTTTVNLANVLASRRMKIATVETELLDEPNK